MLSYANDRHRKCQKEGRMMAAKETTEEIYRSKGNEKQSLAGFKALSSLTFPFSIFSPSQYALESIHLNIP